MDWTKSMKQTFEFYKVDPSTWGELEKINTISQASITREYGNATLGSASFSTTEDFGECYIRVYLVATQDGVTEKFCLGTYLVQTPSFSFNGKYKDISISAYTPLIELKENYPPIGYTALKGQNIMEIVKSLISENVRAPIGEANCNKTLYSNYTADTNDTWLTYISSLLSQADYELVLDNTNSILFKPIQKSYTLNSTWTYTDDNSSIINSDISVDRDLYGIPNVLEVTATINDSPYTIIVSNQDPNSALSIQNRGRKISKRVIDPELSGEPTIALIKEYAKQTLLDLSTLEYTINYKHGYCPVNIGDAVLINYTRAGIHNKKAMVTSQSIDCTTSCQVSEKAVYTDLLLAEDKIVMEEQ